MRECFLLSTVRFCPSGNCLTVLIHMHQISDTTVVVPSGTISSTHTVTAFPPRPTASSETAGEPTLCTSTRQASAAIYTATVMHHCVLTLALHHMYQRMCSECLEHVQVCPSIHCYLQKLVAMETTPHKLHTFHISTINSGINDLLYVHKHLCAQTHTYIHAHIHTYTHMYTKTY